MSSAIPDGHLQGVGLEDVGSHQGIAHGDLGAEVEECRVVQILTGRGGSDIGGRGEAAVEASNPVSARGPDRCPDELVPVEGEHHMKLGSQVEQGLGGENVRPGGERAEPDTDACVLECLLQLLCDSLLFVCGEPANLAFGSDSVTSVMGDRRVEDGSENLGVDVDDFADHSKLTEGCCPRSRIGFGPGGRLEALRCVFGPPEHQGTLGLGDLVPVGVTMGHSPQDLVCHRMRPLHLARDEPHGGGIGSQVRR